MTISWFVPGIHLFTVPLIYFAIVPLTLSTIIQVVGPIIITLYFEAVTGLNIGYKYFGFDFYPPWGWILMLTTAIIETTIAILLITAMTFESIAYILP